MSQTSNTAEQKPENNNNYNEETIGVLLVHGIGEQRQFEHLELEARNIISAIQDNKEPNQIVQVNVNSLPSVAFNAEQQTWQGGMRAPVTVDVIETDQNTKEIKKVAHINFHQVWWADLDEPTTFGTQFRFWLWALSLWNGDKWENKNCQINIHQQQFPKGGGKISWWGRIRLFWVATTIFLLVPLLLLLNALNPIINRLLGLKISGPDILTQFIGDVKLFQQSERIGKGPLEDLGEIPIITIRRRMIRAMVEMALQKKYARWYILAHSQGTVLAFNALMELEETLPNYLNKHLWRRAKNKLTKIENVGNKEECKKLKTQPDMPYWRWNEQNLIIDRELLFKKLNGFLTYGSPLSKFATLWPAIVLLNKNKDVFNQNFKWFNVYDPTDPVAGNTQAFQNQNSETDPQADPKDIPYKADSFHLFSHIEYLTFKKKKSNRLVNKVADWLITDNSLQMQNDEWHLAPSTILSLKFLRIITWLVVALVLGVIISELTLRLISFSLLPSIFSSLQFNQWLIRVVLEGVLYIAVSSLAVLIIGIVVKFFVKDISKL